MNRRRFAVGLGLFATSRLIPSHTFGAQEKKSPDRGVTPLPPRRELLLKNAYVMTMDSDLGDIPGGDVHIKNGAIIAVGKAIKAPGATILDGQRTIVLPGFVDTHWHMWNTMLRSFAGEKADQFFEIDIGAGARKETGAGNDIARRHIELQRDRARTEKTQQDGAYIHR